MIGNGEGCLAAEEKTLHDLIEETIRKMFWEVAKVHLKHCNYVNECCEDLCTVYTTFNGGYDVRFAFCAERSFMKRITENIAEEPVTDQEDIEEYMKEFINVICGHVVSIVYYKTKTGARFHAPRFTDGFYLPPEGDNEKIITTRYTNEYDEAAMLSHDCFEIILC